MLIMWKKETKINDLWCYLCHTSYPLLITPCWSAPYPSTPTPIRHQPLSGSMLVCCWLDHWEHISIKFEWEYNCHLRKLIWKYRLQNETIFLCIIVIVHPSHPNPTPPILPETTIANLQLNAPEPHPAHSTRDYNRKFTIECSGNMVFNLLWPGDAYRGKSTYSALV